MISLGLDGKRRPIWPWLLLPLAAAWVVVVRIPIVLNAAHHLDSDLAVDGLTLLEATRGHFRWNYPGTPFMGIGAVFLSLPQAMAWGVSPVTLVSGGVVAYLGVVAATFALGWIAFDKKVAAWSLVPLAFSSSGTVWLSGRITGGHLLAACWHGVAFAILASALRTGSRTSTFALGLVCGLGLYSDSMFAVSLLGILVALAMAWTARGPKRRDWAVVLLYALGFAAGVWPKPLGSRLDPYDAYREQLSFVTEPSILKAHGTILVQECFPRLLFGHKLPGLESDPDPSTLAGSTFLRRDRNLDALGAGTVALGMVVAIGSLVGLALGAASPATAASRPIVGGLVVSMLAILVGFVANRNIFNSDNYRYLVDLLVIHALGFGIVAERLVRARGWPRAWLLGSVLSFAVLMTADVGRWYARFGWVDGRYWPVRRVVEDPTLAWLDRHPKIEWIVGGYWDVYRLSFLTGGRVQGVPFAIYPNRFPEWSSRPGSGEAWLIRPTPEGRFFQQKALEEGRQIVQQARGVSIYARP